MEWCENEKGLGLYANRTLSSLSLPMLAPNGTMLSVCVMLYVKLDMCLFKCH